ncbi:phosphotransferase family protein [Natrinema salsiterrestre]|uniref:Phosphotransferase n=1 Tax=Natrinema salsiterrestre TaxID=2950540 RepID=A0A9Q4L5W5_9EURY|nr:phosphotransferase [Natrinema salsiterrestre]MDF9747478.1 phosphotransferase [Natrinema salsiterrestre]
MPDWTLQTASPIREGSDILYQLTVTDQADRNRQCILKAAGQTDEDDFRSEPRCTQYFRHATELPIPEVYEVVSDPDGDIPPFFLLSYVSGRSLKYGPDENRSWDPLSRVDRSAIAELSHIAGRHLATIHQCGPVDGFGPLTAEHDQLTLLERDADWDSWITGVLHSLSLHDLRSIEADISSFITREADRLPDIDPVPMHQDYRPGNLVLDPETPRPCAVLDWGDVRSGHDEYELALTEQYFSSWRGCDHQRRSLVREHLYEGYESVRSLDRDDPAFHRRYLLYRLVTRLAFMNRFPQAPEYVREHNLQCLSDLITSVKLLD